MQRRSQTHGPYSKHLPTIGEINRRYEKKVPTARPTCKMSTSLEQPSERLNDRQDHDTNHEQSRYFIDNPIESLGSPILVGAESAHAAHKEAVQPGQCQNECELGVKPA